MYGMLREDSVTMACQARLGVLAPAVCQAVGLLADSLWSGGRRAPVHGDPSAPGSVPTARWRSGCRVSEPSHGGYGCRDKTNSLARDEHGNVPYYTYYTHISLTAVAEGLGSGIIGFGGEEKKAVEALLGLPAGYELVCIMKFGVPAGPVTKPPMRREFSWLHTNTF